jgi:urease accessory protein
MRRCIKIAKAAFAVTALSVAPALAHPGHDAHSVTAGLAHPWAGLDHIAVMIAVGWAGALIARDSLVRGMLLPIGFVAAMVLGALIALQGAPLFWAEPGIVASLAVGALLLWRAGRMNFVTALTLAALSGLPHGAAHGVELPAGAQASQYILGFALSTLALHGLGLIAGFALARPRIDHAPQ